MSLSNLHLTIKYWFTVSMCHQTVLDWAGKTKKKNNITHKYRSNLKSHLFCNSTMSEPGSLDIVWDLYFILPSEVTHWHHRVEVKKTTLKINIFLTNISDAYCYWTYWGKSCQLYSILQSNVIELPKMPLLWCCSSLLSCLFCSF